MALSIRFLFIAPLLWGCDEMKNEKSVKKDNGTSARSVDCDSIAWNYSNVGAPTMLSWCTSCHHSDLTPDSRQGAPPSVNLETYDQVVSFGSRITERVINHNPSPMPPVGELSADEQQRLQEWIGCGMPE